MNELKEVYFDQYCPTCQHKNLPESESPCDECLTEPMNIYSHKPTKWECKENYSRM